AGRALGTGDELAAWVRRHAGPCAAADLCATAVAAIAEVVAETVNTHDVADVVVAGGGTRNRTLLGSLGRGLEPRVVALGAGGIPPEAREAAAMAVLGGLSADGVPITLPAVTGRRATTPRVTADVTS
ncbi:MAG: anhydro-N-acetylmuramic acid kinase, partial [Phycisphaerales bacterium]|nr:anhydro-N-acetylmuramic acid kinase [Phycisphaerales bacterium]